jgi:hypothetical protein
MKVPQLIFNNAARKQSLEWTGSVHHRHGDGQDKFNLEIMALLKRAPRALEFEWQLRSFIVINGKARIDGH